MPLQQVCGNLAVNAVKFTPRGGRVEVRLHERGGAAILTVRDTGKGISPAFLPHVFERFRQADATMTRSHGGLGLGLSLVRDLVELHGGDVQVESPGEGGGTIFTVTLPRRATTAPAAPAIVCTTEARADLDGVRVLVVDDEPDTLELIASVLRDHGAEIHTARSAAEALATFLAATLTAYAEPDVRARVLAAGFQAHLAKPIDPQRLAAVVAELAERRVAQ